MKYDVISRQAAIDEIDEWIKAFRENGHKESAADARLIQNGIIQLPSAQPETHEERTETHACDCISRQAAIDAVLWGITYAKAINKDTGEVMELFKQGNEELTKAVDRIKELPSVEAVPKWIPVTERLPEEDYCTGRGRQYSAHQ